MVAQVVDPSNEVVITVLVAVVTLKVGIGVYRFVMGRYEKITRRWAERNGYELLEWEHTTSSMKAHAVTGDMHEAFLVRVVVRDQSGAQRSGWLRPGKSSFGILSNQVEFLEDPDPIEPE